MRGAGWTSKGPLGVRIGKEEGLGKLLVARMLNQGRGRGLRPQRSLEELVAGQERGGEVERALDQQKRIREQWAAGTVPGVRSERAHTSWKEAALAPVGIAWAAPAHELRPSVRLCSQRPQTETRYHSSTSSVPHQGTRGRDHPAGLSVEVELPSNE